MVFLGTLFEIANLSGILLSFNKLSPYYKMRTLISWSSVFNMVFHTGYFYYRNLDDFDQSTLVIGPLTNILMQLIKVNIILIQNDNLVNLYEKLERICANPNNSNYKNTTKIEKYLELFVRIYLGFVAFVCVAISTNPLLVQLIEYLNTGNVVKYRFELPFPYASPFVDLNSSPAYELTFILFILGIFPLAMFVISPDLLFLGTCAHVTGLMEHLKILMVKVIDDPKDEARLRKVVEIQNMIYDIVKETQSVFGNIFFTQCLGTLFIVCTQIYVATKVSEFKFFLKRLGTDIFFSTSRTHTMDE